MVYVPIHDLQVNKANPRVVRDGAFKKLKESLQGAKGKEMFEARPCIVSNRTGENIIIAGNTRYKAAKELGWKEVPAVIMEGLTEEQEQEIIIRDNVTNGEWDWEALANEWDVVKLEEWGVNIPETIQLEEENEAQEDDFDVPEEVQTDIVIGDVFQIGEHRLLCGDSTNITQVEKLMNGEKADMVFTDPPYGYKYESNYQKKHKQLMNDDKIVDFLPCTYGCTRDDAALYICGSFQTIADWLKYVGEHLNVKNLIVWKKNNWSMGDLKGAYAGQHELIIYATKGRVVLEGGRDTDIWEFDREPPRLHPTMKPIGLVAKALKKHKAPLVADVFLGSGSTMVAAHQLGRKCYGMELDPKYCQVIIDRMRKLDPGLVITRNGELYV